MHKSLSGLLGPFSIVSSRNPYIIRFLLDPGFRDDEFLEGRVEQKINDEFLVEVGAFRRKRFSCVKRRSEMLWMVRIEV